MFLGSASGDGRRCGANARARGGYWGRNRKWGDGDTRNSRFSAARECAPGDYSAGGTREFGRGSSQAAGAD